MKAMSVAILVIFLSSAAVNSHPLSYEVPGRDENYIEDSNNPHDKRLVIPGKNRDPCDVCRSACSSGSATGSCKQCCY
ncbi:hypothetical protein ABFA07_015910 [Porites harrisoni]